jgi:methionine aminotransferase
MTEHPEHHLNLPAFYQERRDYFAKLLAGTKFRPQRSPGTYFQLADYSALSAQRDVEFARWLTIEHGVAVIPISVFYEKPPAELKLVRFCFAKENSTLDAAAERLARL